MIPSHSHWSDSFTFLLMNTDVKREMTNAMIKNGKAELSPVLIVLEFVREEVLITLFCTSDFSVVLLLTDTSVL